MFVYLFILTGFIVFVCVCYLLVGQRAKDKIQRHRNSISLTEEIVVDIRQ